MMEFLHGLNEFFWVLSNLLVLLIFVSATAFGVLYPLWFKVEKATGGWRIWRAILSVGGFGLLAVLGTYIDGRVPAWEMPVEVAPWRPVVRLVVYGLIAQSFAGLVGYVVMRRFFPTRLRTAPEMTKVLESALRLQFNKHIGSAEHYGIPPEVAKTIAKELVKDGWQQRNPDVLDSTSPPPRSYRRRR